MAKKRVVVACGGAVATSTIAANKVRELLAANNIEAEVVQTRISELDSERSADLFVTTAKISKDYGVPVVHGLPYISGFGVDKLNQEILDILKDIK